ncbi:MAG: hypothetical protein FJ149_04240 [Euryarchaeota archaeon]|nr:hypothetical protein [Euryarchaeota archaeon]
MGRNLLVFWAAVLFLVSPLIPCVASDIAPEPEHRALLVLEFGNGLPDDLPARLRECEAEPVAFLPPSSMLVSAGPDRTGLALTLGADSISPLAPEEKLSPSLEAAPETGPVMLWALFTGPRRTLEAGLSEMGARAAGWGPEKVTLEVEASRLGDLARLPQVFWVEPALLPEPVMDRKARTVGARQARDGAFQNDGTSLWSYNNGAFEGTTGAGVNISIVDSGVDGTHPAFDGRKVAFRSYGSTPAWSDQDAGYGHGTMCAGIAAGDGRWRASDPSGSPGRYAGIAPGAGLVGQANIYQYSYTYSIYDLCRDAATRGAQISSNSWSSGANFGQYVSVCREYDTYVRDSNLNVEGEQPLVVVFAAGNSGPTSITVAPPTTAKNVISVGALGNDRTGSLGYVSSSQLASYSSRGPCSDGRIKPDLCAPGLDVYTASAVNNLYRGMLGTVPDDPDGTSYFVGGGTSAACPGVAGACALVIDRWRQDRGATPGPALTKALLINGAEPLSSYPYPGPDQGWGRINVTRSVVPGPGRELFTVDQTVDLATGNAESLLFNVSAASELKVTLVWTDAPGTPAAPVALVNDLDLVVTDPDGNVYRGNNFVNGQSVPGGSADGRNNVEGLLLRTPRPGRYFVNVSAGSVPVGPQDYALVVSGGVRLITTDPAAVQAGAAPSTAFEGEPVRVEFGLSNAGRGTASGFAYEVRLDGLPLSYGTLPDLSPQQSTTVPADWVAVRGVHTFSIDIDPAGLLDELREDNNNVQVDVNVLHFGVGASVQPDRALSDPGSVSAFTVSASNTGTAADTLLVSASVDLPGWGVSLSYPSLELDPGATGYVQLSVSSPDGALAGETATAACTVVSSGNSTYSTLVAVSVVTRQIYSVALSPDPPRVDIYPWESAGFDLSARNGGNGDDTLTLDATMIGIGGEPLQGWGAALSAGSLSLGPRSEGPFSANVTPPALALAGETAVTTVSAYSQGGLSASTVLKVGVKQYFDIDQSFVPGREEAFPGQGVDGIYFLHNLGNGPDAVRLELSGEPGWEVRLEPDVLLSAREIRPGNLTITVPGDALAGVYHWRLVATSSGGRSVSHDFSLRVLQVFALEASPTPRREAIYPGEPVELAISITNLGNGNDTFTVLPEGLPGALSVRSIGGPVPLGARSTAAASVRLLSTLELPPGETLLTFRAVSGGSARTVNTTTMVLVVLPILSAPRETGLDLPQAPDPTVGGSEMCGVVAMIALAVTTAAAIRGRRKWIEFYERERFARR